MALTTFDNYEPKPTSTTLGKNQSNIVATSPTTTNTTQNQSGTSNTNQTTNSSQVQNTNQQVQNMTPADQAALDQLIQQLMGGGTQQMADDRARRIAEIQALQAQRSGYSRANAFTDAQGAMSQQLRLAMEQLMPALTRAAEGAGTSQNSMRALLLQKGANQAAESSAAIGLKAASDYGNVSNGTSQVLAALLNKDDPSVAALIQALGVSKGSVQNTQGTTTTVGSSNTQGTTSTNQITNGVSQNSGGTQTTQYAAPGQTIPSGSSVGTIGYTNPLGLSDSAMDYLNNGGYNPIGNSSFGTRASGSDAYDLSQLLNNSRYTDQFTF